MNESPAKRGRPIKDDARRAVLNVRLTPAERATLERDAALRGVSLADIARVRLIAEVDSEGGGPTSSNVASNSTPITAPEPIPATPADPDLSAVIAAWPTLPLAFKAGILAMIRVAAPVPASAAAPTKTTPGTSDASAAPDGR